MVSAIIDWVEEGQAPTQIVATQYESDASTAGGGFENPTDVAPSPAASRQPAAASPSTTTGPAPAGGPAAAPTGRVVRTLPAFPYPLRPQYNGTGDVNDASSDIGVMPSTPTQDDVAWIGRSTIGP